MSKRPDLACLFKVHNDWARQTGDMSGSTAILSTFEDGVLVMAGIGDSGERDTVPGAGFLELFVY